MRIRLKAVSQNSVFHKIFNGFENRLKHQLSPKHFIFEVLELYDLNERFSFMSSFTVKSALLQMYGSLPVFLHKLKRIFKWSKFHEKLVPIKFAQN